LMRILRLPVLQFASAQSLDVMLELGGLAGVPMTREDRCFPCRLTVRSDCKKKGYPLPHFPPIPLLHILFGECVCLTSVVMQIGDWVATEPTRTSSSSKRLASIRLLSSSTVMPALQLKIHGARSPVARGRSTNFLVKLKVCGAGSVFFSSHAISNILNLRVGGAWDLGGG
jgi:hypothetical protein